MLHEFLVFVIHKMDEKGETYSADFCAGLLKAIQGKTNEEGLHVLEKIKDDLQKAMDEEKEKDLGFTTLMGEHWTNLLNVKQAIRAGNGELRGWQK